MAVAGPRAKAIASEAISRSATSPDVVATTTMTATVFCGLEKMASAASAAAPASAAHGVAPARKRPLGDEIAKQRRYREVVGAPERRDRESQRRHQPVERAERELFGVDRRRDRVGQRRAGDRRHEVRRRRAERQADGDGDQGDDGELDQRQRDDSRPRSPRSP